MPKWSDSAFSATRAASSLAPATREQLRPARRTGARQASAGPLAEVASPDELNANERALTARLTVPARGARRDHEGTYLTASAPPITASGGLRANMEKIK